MGSRGTPIPTSASGHTESHSTNGPRAITAALRLWVPSYRTSSPSRHREIPTRGFMTSEEFSDGTEIEIEIFGLNAELRGDVEDRLLELHQRAADLLGLDVGDRVRFHAANRLALEQPADQFDQRQHQLRYGTL